jgi:hypothetical protein
MANISIVARISQNQPYFPGSRYEPNVWHKSRKIVVDFVTRVA